MSGIPTALNGQIYHELDGIPAVTATSWTVNHRPPLNAKFGFAGFIGSGKGQAPMIIDLEFASTADRQEFNLLALANERKNQARAARNGGVDAGFRYMFWEGDPGISRQWLITNCRAGEFTQTNDPAAGTGSKRIQLMGAPPVQIA